MKINGYAMSLLLGIAFTSTAGAQCPIKDSIMGVGRSFETYDARSTDQRGERPDAMTGATEQHHGADGQVIPPVRNCVRWAVNTKVSAVSVSVVTAKWFPLSRIMA